VGADETVTCTFNNKLLQAAIKILKTSINGPALAHAEFLIAGPNGYSNTVATGSDGTVCVDHLSFGNYTVKETAAPAGYRIDDTTPHNVNVGSSSTCGDGHETTFAATNTPLTDITVTVRSEAPGGTISTISCSPVIGDSPQGPAESATVTAIGLPPGDYVCTVHVDP
jgi:uncharacterized surface anchored protein